MKDSSNENTQLKNIAERFQSFYIEEFEDIIRKYKRKPFLSIFFKIIYAFQLLSLMYSFKLQENLTSSTDKYLMNPFMGILNSTKIFPLLQMAFGWDEVSSVNIFIILSILVNSIFLFYIAFRLILKLIRGTKSKLSLKWQYFDDISSCYF